ncbi:MAG: EF-hand domain-containing protein [Pseudomonadota bacterium]
MSIRSIAISCAVCASISLSLPATAQEVQFQLADADSNGMLDAAEFRVFIDTIADQGAERAQMVRDRGMYGMAFQRMDGDGNGVLTVDELPPPTN